MHQTTNKPEWMTYPTAERQAPRFDMSLTNPDLAPVSAERRTWSWWHIASLWIGMAAVLWLGFYFLHQADVFSFRRMVE